MDTTNFVNQQKGNGNSNNNNCWSSKNDKKKLD